MTSFRRSVGLDQSFPEASRSLSIKICPGPNSALPLRLSFQPAGSVWKEVFFNINWGEPSPHTRGPEGGRREYGRGKGRGHGELRMYAGKIK